MRPPTPPSRPSSTTRPTPRSGPSATPSRYQRPQVLAVRSNLANYGAGNLADDDFTKVGWLTKK
ncbi:hypothetical protein [Streptomyces avermitilis]|uniref:hypothetical protein n=1 Tax=Streptomyces avermitilis TaxID=33903 RepID=UPI003F4D0DAF